MASIDDTQELLTERIRVILSRETRFNNPEWILSHDLPMIRRILKNYRKQLRLTLGSFIQSNVFDKMVNESVTAFIDNMKEFISKGKIKLRQANQKQLLRAVRREYGQLLFGSVDGMTQRLLQKSTAFKLNSSLARIPKAIEESALNKINTVRIKGEEFNSKQLTNVWGQLTNRYGQHDTVIFKGGHKKPLETYVDGRTTTTRAEIDRATTQITAAANGVFFGRINVTGTRDSCIFHEGRLVFFTQSGREQFKAQNPGVDVSAIKTVQELEEDDTHIFKFHCRHRVLAEGFQFFEKEEQDEIIKENKALPKIPKQVVESKVKREIELDRFAA